MELVENTTFVAHVLFCSFAEDGERKRVTDWFSYILLWRCRRRFEIIFLNSWTGLIRTVCEFAHFVNFKGKSGLWKLYLILEKETETPLKIAHVQSECWRFLNGLPQIVFYGSFVRRKDRRNKGTEDERVGWEEPRHELPSCGRPYVLRSEWLRGPLWMKHHCRYIVAL